MILFVDSSAYIAYYNKRDRNHARAVSLVERIRKREFGPTIIYTSDYIFDEVVTAVLLLTRNKNLAIRIGEAIRSSEITRIIKVSDDIFQEAWEMFKKYKDKLWSFTDCTSFVIMKRKGIRTAFTFDEHYKEAGFIMIP